MIQERRRAQADWLAQSGWSLALTRLQSDAEYKGETWEIPATELGGADAGRVRISVTTPTAETSAGTKDVSIIAEFPMNSDRKVQVTRQRTWRTAKP